MILVTSMLFALTRSNSLRQLPDLNQIIRRLKENCFGKRFNWNIFVGIAIIETSSNGPWISTYQSLSRFSMKITRLIRKTTCGRFRKARMDASLLIKEFAALIGVI